MCVLLWSPAHWNTLVLGRCGHSLWLPVHQGNSGYRNLKLAEQAAPLRTVVKLQVSTSMLLKPS